MSDHLKWVQRPARRRFPLPWLLPFVLAPLPLCFAAQPYSILGVGLTTIMCAASLLIGISMLERDRSLGRFIYLGVVLTVLLVVTVLFFDPYFLSAMSLVGGLYLGVPAFAIGLVACLRQSTRLQGLGLLLLLVTGAIFLTIALPLNRAVKDHAVEHAKAYPASVIPQLEAYRQTHGAYPRRLDDLPSRPRFPMFISELHYYSDGKTYSFWFSPPGSLMEDWIYESATQNWRFSS